MQRHESSRSRIAELAGRLLLTCSLACAAPLALAATDVVVFGNGDRLTGEVKSLARGKLRFDTDPTGVIDIEWDKVAYISIDQNIQVETASGARYFGHVRMASDGHKALVDSSDRREELENRNVVAMNPIDEDGFRDVDLRVSAGYNFTKASSVTQFNVGMDANYRTRKRILSADFSSLISDSSNNEASQRQSLAFNYTRLRSRRWLNDGGISFDRNDELGLNLRTSLSAGVGRILTQSNSGLFILKGGLKATRENNINQPDDVDSLESYGLMTWEWFRFDDPELDWSTTLEIIPSLTESGRVRSQFDATLRWEIINDFFWQLEFYDSTDNQPRSDTAANRDYGITTSVSYKF